MRTLQPREPELLREKKKNSCTPINRKDLKEPKRIDGTRPHGLRLDVHVLQEVQDSLVTASIRHAAVSGFLI